MSASRPSFPGRASGPAPRATGGLIVWFVFLLIAFAAFVALGTWQIERRAWKLDLIERVDQRVHADPVAAPGAARWPAVTAEGDEYRHVRLSGRYLPGPNTLVQASTELGAGYWVLTPLSRGDGSVVLVNRGFVPQAQRTTAIAEPAPGGPVTVTGLLRLSEPGGGFLRDNDPAAGRWYSRDVQAIARARGLGPVAPYFVDAGVAGGEPPAGAPVPGLTVVRFHNSHLVYTITWYALAAMTLGAAVLIARDERRRRRVR
ncbi:SURF1 family protein [Alloalcanivorax mobilis]|uniref:SURF1 family protein n=1 Tax=Alloalcanivorax mobilis TaxID=2019569 RepID=UPI000C78574B|nr:SURF1 family protein [Alloalcanivorax mobilis]